MMSLNSGYSPAFFPIPDPHSSSQFHDWTTDHAIVEASRRLSRTHNGQRSGSSMRISKPSSANNSPGASSLRRTMAGGDGQSYKRTQQTQEQPSLLNNANRPARPVSWHPSSHIFTPQPYAMHQHQQPAFPPLTPAIYTEQQELVGAYPSLSPVMASYSNNTSPCSGFSPLPMANYQNCTPQYLNQAAWDLPQPSQYPQYPDAIPALTHGSNLDTPAANNMDWTSYMPHGMSNTTPPTPDSFVCLPQSEPAVSEDPVPFESLDTADDEDEGEILVGMGLYDTPEKYEEDPQLNNYRSTAGYLLGAPYQRKEPTGKGLKLEETWVPPQSDESGDDEEDEEEEEGSDDED